MIVDLRFSFLLLLYSSFRQVEKKKRLTKFSLSLSFKCFRWRVAGFISWSAFALFCIPNRFFILWQPQVSSASVNLTTEVAIVWPVSEAKLTPNWQKQLGETLAKHLTNCGFNSNIRGTHFKFHYHQLVIVFLFYFFVHIWVWIPSYLLKSCMLG